MERIYITKKQLDALEQKIRLEKHLDRYFMIRQFCYGNVLDVACGVGYGSYIISSNPDVARVTGADISEEAIAFAKKEYGSEKTGFIAQEISEITMDVDVLVSIETIEHMKDPSELASLAERCNVHDIIISYPIKKSTHFNPYHYYDFYDGDILKIFKLFRHYNTITLANEVNILFLTRAYDTNSQPRKYYSCKR